MNTLVANEGWKEEEEENHRFRRRRVRGAEKNFIEPERMSKQGKLLMLLLNDGQINSKVWDVVHFIESGN